GTSQLFVISSNMATANTRGVGFVLTLLHQAWVHWLGSAEGARKGPHTSWHKGNSDSPFRPRGSGRGHRSGVGACFRDTRPGSKARTSARRSAVTRTGRVR